MTTGPELKKKISRHPSGPETAFIVEDVAPGAKYIKYIPGDQSTVERGEFSSFPAYDEDDGHFATAKVKMGEEVVLKTVFLRDYGITPYYDGERWADAVTIPDDSDE
jgi:hypothetical protein